MVDPFGLAGELVKGLVESVEGVRTNREDCALLVARAKQTPVLLNEIKSEKIGDQTLSKAVDYLNEALKRAQDAIDNCCNTGCFCAMLLHKTHSSKLHQAEKDLNYALLQIPLAALGINFDIQHDLANLVQSKSREEFQGRSTRTQKTNTLKIEIEQVYKHMNEGFEEMLAQRNQEIENLKNQTGQIQKLGLQLEKTKALMGTEILVQDIVDISANAKINEDGCTLLARLAQQTLTLLDKFNASAVSNVLVMAALCHVNEALAIVKNSISDCSNTDFFHGAIFHESYSSRLKKASTMLGNALAEMLPLLDGMSLTIQSTLSSLCDELHDLKFDGSVDVESDDILFENPNDFVGSSQQIEDFNALSLSDTSTSEDSIENPLFGCACLNSQNTTGHTPLHIASGNNHVNIVKLLIANGAVVNLQNNKGESPLFVASNRNHIDVVKEHISALGTEKMETTLEY